MKCENQHYCIVNWVHSKLGDNKKCLNQKSLKNPSTSSLDIHMFVD
jgi:hypothetical protein